jgi:hypothetical protein
VVNLQIVYAMSILADCEPSRRTPSIIIQIARENQRFPDEKIGIAHKGAWGTEERRISNPRLLDVTAFLHRDGNLLDDLQSKAFERGNVHGRIRQQPNAVDAQVREDLAAESNGTQDPPAARL